MHQIVRLVVGDSSSEFLALPISAFAMCVCHVFILCHSSPIRSVP